jgi:MFS family permease
VNWLVLTGGFLSYLFDAIELLILTIALPLIMTSMGLTKPEAGLLITATLLGVGCSSLVTGRYDEAAHPHRTGGGWGPISSGGVLGSANYLSILRRSLT